MLSAFSVKDEQGRSMLLFTAQSGKKVERNWDIPL